MVLAALVPSLLFYFGLFVQIDGYAAQQRPARPAARRAAVDRRHLRRGLAVHLRLRAAGVDAAGAAAGGDGAVLRHRAAAGHQPVLAAPPAELEALGALLEGVSGSLAELAALLAGVGLIIGSLSVTGLAGTLANDLVYLAGNNIYVLLVMGALTSFIFGMGMTITACYIFLAIVLAPPLVAAGFDPVAVHLFMMYWGMVSFITPPVALASFVAAGLAGARAAEGRACSRCAWAARCTSCPSSSCSTRR